MANDDSNLITETEAILKLFQEYFKQILNEKYVVEVSDKYQKISGSLIVMKSKTSLTQTKKQQNTGGE